MSRVRADKLVDKAATGRPELTKGAYVPVGVGYTGEGGVNVGGAATALSFHGSGANLTDLSGTAIASGTVAAARVATLNQNTSGTAGGLTGTPNITVGNISAAGGDLTIRNVTGVAATFTGVLTYEDVTNVDSVGVVTARGGFEIGAAGVGGTITAVGNAQFTGITTSTGGLEINADSKSLKIGAGEDLTLQHDGTQSIINDTGNKLQIRSDLLQLMTASGKNEYYFQGAEDGAATIYHDNSAKLSTSATGVTITGNATATQFIGVSTGGTASGATVGVGTTSTILGVTDGATQNRFSGVLVEKASIQATNITSGTIDLAQGNVHYFSTNGSGASTAAIKYKGGNNLSSYMKVGENISISIISKPNNSEYINAVTVDGAAVTEEWLGGETPSATSGAASSFTITSINLTRIASTGTANSDYLVLVSVLNYA